MCKLITHTFMSMKVRYGAPMQAIRDRARCRLDIHACDSAARCSCSIDTCTLRRTSGSDLMEFVNTLGASTTGPGSAFALGPYDDE